MAAINWSITNISTGSLYKHIVKSNFKFFSGESLYVRRKRNQVDPIVCCFHHNESWLRWENRATR